MAKTLFEAYAKRLDVAEKAYSMKHEGETLDNARKLTVAKCLQNVNRFMNEAFEASQGTQRTDMGLWKRFTMNVTNVALPNLIGNDLVIVHPMTSMAGYIAYLEYSYSRDKGQTQSGDLIANPFGFGKVDVNYSGAHVVETVTTNGSGVATLAWTPIYNGDAAEAKATVVGHETDYVVTVSDDQKSITVTQASGGAAVASTEIKVKYVYDNIVVPQDKLPTIKAEMKSKALVAKARRIAVFYSQIAAFQAKTDYGVDLGEQLAARAVGELSYEIDTEITTFLYDMAKKNTTGSVLTEMTWSKTLPVGVSKREHYEGFAEILEIGRQIVYDRTQKFAPNFLLVASNILPILTLMTGFKAAPAGAINGPYFAGTIGALRVYVTPNMDAGDFVIGVKGDDEASAAAVYAPYMPIVPTQLLQFADGGTTQGFSTMYDLAELNPQLVVLGKVTA